MVKGGGKRVVVRGRRTGWEGGREMVMGREPVRVLGWGNEMVMGRERVLKILQLRETSPFLNCPPFLSFLDPSSSWADWKGRVMLGRGRGREFRTEWPQ
jgi:hypothetical protein